MREQHTGVSTRPLALFAVMFGALVAVPAVPGTPGWLDRLSVAAVGTPLPPKHAFLVAAVALVFARGVLLRRRAAWYGLTAAVALGTLAVLAGDGGPWHLPVLVFAAAVLWRSREMFDVAMHPARIRTAIKFGAVLVIVAAAGAVLFGGVSVRAVGPELVAGLGGAGTSMQGAAWLSGLLGVTGAFGLLGIMVILMAPAPAPAPGDELERRNVAGLVAHPGSDTLAPFALRRDKSYVFSPDRRAAVGYRVLFGVAVVGGDPVGDPGSYDAAIDAFLELSRRNGWRPAALGASEQRLASWQGMRSIGFGDEVVLDAAEFSLGGRKMRNVRQAVQRTHNFGVKVEVLPEAELPAQLRAELRDVAANALEGNSERGFSMCLDEMLTGHHPGALVAVAYDGDGRPVAFQRYMTTGTALSLDAMRRAPDGPNGLNERLIAEVVDYAKENGFKVVSLNFAAFRTLLDSEDRNLAERAGYQALHAFDRWIAVESLYLFNRKFRPQYHSRSVVFRSWSDLGWVAAALLTLEFGPARTARPAEAPEGVPVAASTSRAN